MKLSKNLGYFAIGVLFYIGATTNKCCVVCLIFFGSLAYQQTNEVHSATYCTGVCTREQKNITTVKAEQGGSGYCSRDT